MSKAGDMASRALDTWHPRGTGGKAAKIAAKGIRGVFRAIDPLGDNHMEDGECHMRTRRGGKVCGKPLATRQPTCGHARCQTEWMAATHEQEFTDTRTIVRRGL
jgi:hypothetical protein